MTATRSLVRFQPSRRVVDRSILEYHRSRDRTRFCEDRWRRCKSSRWYDNRFVRVIRSGPPCGVITARVISSPMARLIGRRLGRAWRPKPSSSVRFAGDLLTRHLGVAQEVERIVRDDEAAGAIPVTQTAYVNVPVLSSTAEWAPDKRLMQVRLLQDGLWSMPK